MFNFSRKVFCLVFVICLVISFATTVQAQLTIMPLGDSITKGATDPNDDGYRRQLYGDLNTEDVNFKFVGATSINSSATLTAAGDQYHNGYGSYTIGDLAANLAGSYQPTANSPDSNEGGYWLTGGGGTGRAAVNPNVVLLTAGTNDLALGESLSTMETSMTTLLDWFSVNRPNTVMILGTIIPRASYGALGASNYQSINDEAIAFNSWLTSTAPTISKQDHVIDLYDLFVTTPGSDTAVKTSSSADGIYLNDGAHPSTNGYNAIGNAWNAAILIDAPEPSTWALMLAGVTGLFFLRSRLLRSRPPEL